MLRLFYIILALLVSSAASSREVKVGTSTVTVSPPAGFCEIDSKNSFDKTWLDSTTNLFKSAGIYTIAAFPDCKELQKSRKTGEFIITKLNITAPFDDINKSGPDTLQKECDEARAYQVTEKEKSDADKAVKDFANGSSNLDRITLGMLEESKGVVCYAGQLMKLKTRENTNVTMVSLYAITLAKGTVFALYQFTPYTDSSSIPTALANLKIIYSDFARANSK